MKRSLIDWLLVRYWLSWTRKWKMLFDERWMTKRFTFSFACSTSVRAVSSSYWMERTFSFDVLKNLAWVFDKFRQIFTSIVRLSHWLIGYFCWLIHRSFLEDDVLDHEDFPLDVDQPMDSRMKSTKARWINCWKHGLIAYGLRGRWTRN